MNVIFYFSKIYYFYENKCNYLTFYNLSISFFVSHFLSLQVVFFLHVLFLHIIIFLQLVTNYMHQCLVLFKKSCFIFIFDIGAILSLEQINYLYSNTSPLLFLTFLASYLGFITFSIYNLSKKMLMQNLRLKKASLVR